MGNEVHMPNCRKLLILDLSFTPLLKEWHILRDRDDEEPIEAKLAPSSRIRKMDLVGRILPATIFELCPELEVLDLRTMGQVITQGALIHLPSLRHLSMGDLLFTENTPFPLRLIDCPKLENLKLLFDWGVPRGPLPRSNIQSLI